MAIELEGKTAIVTGGATGIGRGIVELFVAEGAQVVIADVDEEMGAHLCNHLGGQTRFKRTDVARRDEMESLVEFALREFGDLDVMVNNAGVMGAFQNRFLDDDLADFDRVMRVNVAGTLYGCQFAARHMRKNRRGSIINLSSVASLSPGFAIPTYRASKSGVNNLTRSLAIDLGEYDIRVNAIAPGSVPSKMGSFSDPSLPPERAAQLEAALNKVWLLSQPIKRRGTPRDVANAALFFASDRSTYVTGQVLGVDGGGSAGDMINRSALLIETRARFDRGEEP